MVTNRSRSYGAGDLPGEVCPGRPRPRTEEPTIPARAGLRRLLLAALTLAVTWSLFGPSPARAGTTSTTTTVSLAGRTYLLHAQVHPTEPEPLLVVLHGLNGTASRLRTATGWSEFADAHGGFTVVYPQATTTANGHPAWNSGGCCQRAATDDVSALRGVVADVRARTPVDPSRIYVVGFSNGDMMAWRLVCEAGDLFAAGGGAAGVLDPGGEFSCPDPVRFRELHGADDATVPERGGPAAFRPGVFPPWAGEDPGRGTAPGSIVTRRTDLPCGHAWPRLDNDCAYDGDADLWTFLSAFRTLPPGAPTPPAAPTGLVAAAGPGAVTLSWAAPGDRAVTGYTLYRDGAPLAATETTGWVDSGVPAGSHSYAVSAHDAAGRSSPVSPAVAAAVPDGTRPTPPGAPVVTATSPAH